jgi:hypothetical protein
VVWQHELKELSPRLQLLHDMDLTCLAVTSSQILQKHVYFQKIIPFEKFISSGKFETSGNFKKSIIN